MKIYFIVITLFVSKVNYAQTCNCDSTFKTIKYHIENNYAGWFDKLNDFNKKDFGKLSKAVSKNTKQIIIDSLCYKEIKRYVEYFKDGHLHVNYIKQVSVITPAKNEIPVEIQKKDISESAMISYLNSFPQIDFAEGIWENETYKIAILKSKISADLFEGVILTSKNPNWIPGEIKLYVEKKANSGYKIKFVTGDKSEIIEKKVSFFKNILDGESIFLSKLIPKVENNISLDEYTLETDPANPKLTFPKNDLAVWTFPNFYTQGVVEILLEKHKEKLSTIKYWIVDLRENEGGDVSVGNKLLPFIYTNPIIWYQEKTRLTEDNFNNLYNNYISEAIEGLPAEQKKYYDSTFAITKTHFGEYGDLYNKTVIADTIKFDSITLKPEKVILLINNNTFSSGELFTILARQSNKVTVVGQNSAGSIDYGNILRYKTNCPSITITLPSTRNNWLDYGISIDRDKVKPNIYLGVEVKDWIEYSYDHFLQKK